MPLKRRDARLATALLLALPGFAGPALAHGVVGDRFFPATIATDDPFAADELALPTITSFNHETDFEAEWSKSIFPGFAISIGAGYVDSRDGSGFENVSLKPAFELFRNEEHETIVTGAFEWEIGGSGGRPVADKFSTYTPELLFGKGFGDLPDPAALLRPLAFTGQLGLQIPAATNQSKAVIWGGAVEYSLLYLQNNVRDQGLPAFAARFTPVVEFSLQTPTDRGGGETTGTIDPGLYWSGQYIQLGAEAMVPINRASGRAVGIIGQLHFYVDDIFPQSLGRPIFGSER
jgi:hypothetical protein